MKRQNITNDKQSGDKLNMRPLHSAVEEKIRQRLADRFMLLPDPACEEKHEGKQHLSFLVGKEKKRATRSCCVDLLILSSGRVSGIVEIEESNFIPTTIRGKFFQAVLDPYFIHNAQGEGSIPYADKVIFIQALDISSLQENSHKEAEAERIEREIQDMLPLGGVTAYRLFTVSGTNDHAGLDALGEFIQAAFV